MAATPYLDKDIRSEKEKKYITIILSNKLKD